MASRTRSTPSLPSEKEEPSSGGYAEDKEGNERGQVTLVTFFFPKLRKLRGEGGDETEQMGRCRLPCLPTVSDKSETWHKSMEETKKRQGELVSLTEELKNDLTRNAEKKDIWCKAEVCGSKYVRWPAGQRMPPARPIMRSKRSSEISWNLKKQVT